MPDTAITGFRTIKVATSPDSSTEVGQLHAQRLGRGQFSVPGPEDFQEVGSKELKFTAQILVGPS